MKNVRVSRFYSFRDHTKVTGFTFDITLEQPFFSMKIDDFVPEEVVEKLKEIRVAEIKKAKEAAISKLTPYECKLLRINPNG